MEMLGRTNQIFPPVWLALREANDPTSGWAQALVERALAAQTVLDITSRTALWGGFMRGTDATLMVRGGKDCAHAPDSDSAANYIHAHLVSTLSSIGRDHIDFYFLDYRSAWEEPQLNGALEALETAKQDGLIRFVGLADGGNELATLGMWQFHDGFDVVLFRKNPLQTEAAEVLEPLAQTRRVGVVTEGILDWGDGKPFIEVVAASDPVRAAQQAIATASETHPVLVEVRTPEEVELAIGSGAVVPDAEQVADWASRFRGALALQEAK